MRPGGPAGLAHFADDLPTADAVPCGYNLTRLMQEHSDETLTMVDQGQAAFEMHGGFGQDDQPGRGSVNGRPHRSRQIDPVVGPLGLAIQDTLAAEAGGYPFGYKRPVEAVLETVGVVARAERPSLAFGFGGDARQQGRIGRET